MTAVNKLLADKDEILTNFEMVKKVLFDVTTLDAEHAELQSEMAVIAVMIQKCVDENTRVVQSQDEYRQRYEVLVSRFETAKRRYEEVGDLRSETKARRDMVEAFVESIRKQEGLVTGFDERLLYCLVDYTTVYSEADVRFTFKDGTFVNT